MQAQQSRTLTCGIAVMAKASARGQAKTRLAPPLTLDEAAEFNTAFLRDIADNLLAAGSQAPIQGLIAFGPPGSEDFFTAIMPREIKLVECWFPDFGACLLHAMSSILHEGYASGIVLNADSPTLPAAYLAEAAQLLARPGDRAVLGPSSDGGYYLLGLKEPHRHLFEDIAWSTERVAEQTIERAHEIGLPIHALPTWYDIDDRESLRTLYGELFENRCYGAPSQASPAHHTKALMQRLLADADLARRAGLPARSQSQPAASRAVRAVPLPSEQRRGMTRPHPPVFVVAQASAKAGSGTVASRLGWGVAGLLVAAHGAAVGSQLANAFHAHVVFVLIEGLIYAGAAWMITTGRMNPSAGTILAIAALLRIAVLGLEPYHSERHLQMRWDGRVQGAGITPISYIPNDAALSGLRDTRSGPTSTVPITRIRSIRRPRRRCSSWRRG